MAATKRKAPAPAADDARPAQPSWRQPPARPRKKRRTHQATASPVAARAAEARRPAETRAPRPALAVGEAARRAGLVLLTVVLAAVLLFLLRAPQLTVSATSTQIGGTQRVAADRVYRASGLEGRSIFLVRPAEVAARIRQEPGIAEVDVHLRLPNQVLIDVHEYVPVVAWQGITTTVWLTADGIEVPLAGALPPIQLNDRTGQALEESRDRWPHVLPDILALHDALPQVTDVYYGQREGLYFRSPEGWTIWLGDSGQVAAKIALLKSAGQEITARGAQPEIIDLRFSDTKALWW